VHPGQGDLTDDTPDFTFVIRYLVTGVENVNVIFHDPFVMKNRDEKSLKKE
jgi:hypothetical protein